MPIDCSFNFSLIIIGNLFVILHMLQASLQVLISGKYAEAARLVSLADYDLSLINSLLEGLEPPLLSQGEVVLALLCSFTKLLKI